MNSFRKALTRAVLRPVRRFLRDDRGTETLEWGLICGLIIVGAIAMITLIGPKIQQVWEKVNNSLPDSSAVPSP
jgi:Flp pilus assembly pilin Flp